MVLLFAGLIRISLCLFNTRNLVLTVQHFDLRQIHKKKKMMKKLNICLTDRMTAAQLADGLYI